MTASLISVMFAAVISNNIVLSQYQGICPFLGVSKKNIQFGGYGLCRDIRHGDFLSIYMAGL